MSSSGSAGEDQRLGSAEAQGKSPLDAFVLSRPPPGWVRPTHAGGGQSALLTGPRQSLVSAGTPSRIHPDYCWTEHLGTVSPSQVDP